MPLAESHRTRLRQIAWDAIQHGLRRHAPPTVNLDAEPFELRERHASFVTLEREGRLRGCIGSLEARRALAEDVSENAYAAAFCDTRFPPLRPEEADSLTIRISVLQPPAPLEVHDEDELVRALRPGRDGLILQRRERRATFLPAVWDDLPDPRSFVRHLKIKAGLPTEGWDPAIRCCRYETESF